MTVAVRNDLNTDAPETTATGSESMQIEGMATARNCCRSVDIFNPYLEAVIVIGVLNSMN